MVGSCWLLTYSKCGPDVKTKTASSRNRNTPSIDEKHWHNNGRDVRHFKNIGLYSSNKLSNYSSASRLLKNKRFVLREITAWQSTDTQTDRGALVSVVINIRYPLSHSVPGLIFVFKSKQTSPWKPNVSVWYFYWTCLVICYSDCTYVCNVSHTAPGICVRMESYVRTWLPELDWSIYFDCTVSVCTMHLVYARGQWPWLLSTGHEHVTVTRIDKRWPTDRLGDWDDPKATPRRKKENPVTQTAASCSACTSQPSIKP